MSDKGSKDEGLEKEWGLEDKDIPNVGSVTDDTGVYRVRRLSQVLRRRFIAAGAVIVTCIVAIAVPVVALVDRSEGAPSSDQTTLSTSVTAAEHGQSTESVSSTAVSQEEQVDLTARAITLGANELGQIPILMYHKIGNDIVPPARLRDDIARLKAAGFYPTTVREMVSGTMDIPAGKSPVILTFDDSSPTHYRILADGRLDPDCAAAIMLEAVAAGDWAPKASFFPLLYLETSANILFGQPEYAQKKLQDLVSWGFEIGSHTVDHLNLAKSSPGHITQELADSKARLEELIGGGYQIYTLNPPYGEFPADRSLLNQYKACLRAGGGYCSSPFSADFDPMYIPRVSAYKTSTVPDLVWYFNEYPKLRYVSDGDPDLISAPADLAETLGALRTGLAQQVVWY